MAAAQAAWRTVAQQTGTWASNQPNDPPNTHYMLNYTDRGLQLLRSAGNTAWQAVNSERGRQAVIEGAPFIVQGAGFIANRPDVIGAGVGLAALDGVKEVLTAAYRTYQIWAHPDRPQQNPNWVKAAAGVTNIAANALYGRGNAGEGSMRLTGGAGVMVGASLVARNLAPDAGQYVPPPTLPLYQQPNVPLQPYPTQATYPTTQPTYSYTQPTYPTTQSTNPYAPGPSSYAPGPSSYTQGANPYAHGTTYRVSYTASQQPGSTSADAANAAAAAMRRGNGNGNSSGRAPGR